MNERAIASVAWSEAQHHPANGGKRGGQHLRHAVETYGLTHVDDQCPALYLNTNGRTKRM